MTAPTSTRDTSTITPSWLFNYLIDGEGIVWFVTLAHNRRIADLKIALQQGREAGLLKGIEPCTLELLKVNIDLRPLNDDSVRDLKFESPMGMDSEKLSNWKSVSEYWSNEPPSTHLHIIVKLPTTATIEKHPHSPPDFEELPPPKRARGSHDQQPCTPPSSMARTELFTSQAKTTPPRLNCEKTVDAMIEALEPFKSYIRWLADGKLDGYLNSIRREDKVKAPGVVIPNDLCLLLHDIGTFSDEERIRKLFVDETNLLFNTSGSGKTRLLLEGLCNHWGIYLTCQSGRPSATFGSSDFQVATKMLTEISTWDPTAQNFEDNAATADHVFAMLMCARVFVFKELLDHIPPQTDMKTARRRWVLLQSLPGCHGLGGDIFAEVVRSLRTADTGVMGSLVQKTLENLMAEREDLFQSDASLNGPLFLVIDEAQVAANSFQGSFCSHIKETVVRPILHAMYRYLQETRIFCGTIISGTGLSASMVMDSIGSLSAKRLGGSQKPLLFTDMGLFRADQSQVAYVHRYLGLSDNNVSDRRLMERILYWFSGRPRPTASLIELLLYEKNPPKHRVLTAFVHTLTGFTVMDEEDLEDNEPPISAELMQRIRTYGQLTTVERLFKENDDELLQCVVDVLMRWVLGSQSTAVEGHMHQMIAMGIGHLKTDTRNEYNPPKSYPVFIDEPLVVLALSSLFEQQTWSTRRDWIVNSFRTSRNAVNSGYILEEALLLVLMQHFGGKFTALGNVFHFSQPSPLASRKVTLVALRRTAEGVMRCCRVSWNAGGSDHFGFKAKSPSNVLEYFKDPRGKPFLFPDSHMGPDLTCFLQDEKTQELILLVLQAKIKEVLDVGAWQNALTSVEPDFFYTIVKDEKRSHYAPLTYPDLSESTRDFLRATLGSEADTPVVTPYCTKFRSSTRKEKAAALLPTRHTPRYLCVIATPDDERHQQRLEAVANCAAVLKWKVVEEYTGLTADIMRQQVDPVN